MRGLKKTYCEMVVDGVLGKTIKASSANNRNDPTARRRVQVQTASAIDTKKKGGGQRKYPGLSASK